MVSLHQLAWEIFLAIVSFMISFLFYGKEVFTLGVFKYLGAFFDRFLLLVAFPLLFYLRYYINKNLEPADKPNHYQ